MERKLLLVRHCAKHQPVNTNAKKYYLSLYNKNYVKTPYGKPGPI
jgi:hypothetical protein